MLLEVTHETVFEYSQPVRESYVEFRLTPLTDVTQRLLQHRQRVSPSSRLRQYVDSSGNTVSYMNHLLPCDRIEVAFDSVVETLPGRFRGRPLPPQQRDSPFAQMLLFDYLRPTPLTEWGEEFSEYVRPLVRLRGAPPQEAAQAVREAIHGGFRYERNVTSATSSIVDVLRHGAGVCQDFTHLMIATCRYLGFAARYVSGYVLTGGAGADNSHSHAWCEVFDPDAGWGGEDPTHNCPVDERYIRLGIGRDVADVPPNRGLFRGSADERMTAVVRIQEIEPAQLEARSRALYPYSHSERGERRRPKTAPISIIDQTLHAQQRQQQQ